MTPEIQAQLQKADSTEKIFAFVHMKPVCPHSELKRTSDIAERTELVRQMAERSQMLAVKKHAERCTSRNPRIL